MPDRHVPPLGRRPLLRAGGTGLAALLTGCQTGSEPAPTPPAGTSAATPATRTPAIESDSVVMHTRYRWKHLWQATLAPAFEAKTGIELTFEWDAPHNSLRQLLELGEPPDVHTSRFREMVTLWEESLASPDRHPELTVRLEPTTEVVDAATDRFGTPVVEPHAAAGEHWQVPHGYYASTLAYRSDVYDRLGLDAPTSFEALVENARVIDESNMDVRGYAIPGRNARNLEAPFQAYLARMGVSPIGLRWRDPDARTELAIDFPEREVTTLLEFFDELSQYSPEPTALGRADAMGAWAEGRVAQQHDLNAGLAARTARSEEDSAAPDGLASVTEVAPLPYWEAGGAGQGDSWAYEPRLDGHAILRDGGNPTGATAWLSWLYAERPERAGLLYTASPGGALPAFDDVRETEKYRTQPLFEEYPHVLEQLDYVRDTVVADHYGNVSEADLGHPIALYVSRAAGFGQTVRRVLGGEASVEEAYELGLSNLEGALEDARRYLAP